MVVVPFLFLKLLKPILQIRDTIPAKQSHLQDICYYLISNFLILQNKQKYNPLIHHRRSIRLKGYDYSEAGAYFITICCQDRKCRFGKIVAGEMVLNDFGIIAYDQWLTLTERFTTIELDVFQIMPNHMHGIIVINESTVGATLAVAPDDADNHNIRAGTSPEYAVAPDDANDLDIMAGAGYPVAPEDVNDLDIKAGAGHVVAGKRAGASPAPTVANETNATIGGIVGAYKSLVANACLNLFKIKNETMGKLWQRNYYEHIIRNEKSYQTISDYIVNNPDKWIDDKFFIP